MTAFQSTLTSMREKSKSFIYFATTGQFYLPGQHLWVGGPTLWCRVFCSPSRLFRRDIKLHCHLSGL